MTDYYNKYSKYKSKYIELKKNNMIGGEKIKLTKDNTNIIQITTKKMLKLYKKQLTELTKICEPDDDFKPKIKKPYDIFWIAEYKETNEIIGYVKSTDLTQFIYDKNFELVGGIKNKKGIQISGACNGIPNKYSNLATLLLDEIEKYAKENSFDYILLHAGTDRDYLISENTDRPGLYIKNGYEKIRILPKGEGDFANIDLWIMRKILND